LGDDVSQVLDIIRGVLKRRGYIASVECGHATAFLLRDDNLNAVPLKDSNGGAAHRRIVVVDRAGVKEGNLPSARLRYGSWLSLLTTEPLDEGLPMIHRKVAVSMNPHHFLQQDAEDYDPVGGIDEWSHHLRYASEVIRLPKDLILKRDSCSLRLNSLGAEHEAREIDLPVVRWRIGAMVETEFALVAEINDGLKISSRQILYILALAINEIEKRRK